MSDKASQVAVLVKIIGALALVSVSAVDRRPRLVWNGSKSVPIGLYVLGLGPWSNGSIVALRLSLPARRMAARRRYLAVNAVMLKPVAAMAGDRVCRWQSRISINCQYRADAARQDAAGRLLPVWRGCKLLQHGEIFVLSAVSGSFDSRYFGPVRHDAVIGTARSIVSF